MGYQMNGSQAHKVAQFLEGLNNLTSRTGVSLELIEPYVEVEGSYVGMLANEKGEYVLRQIPS